MKIFFVTSLLLTAILASCESPPVRKPTSTAMVSTLSGTFSPLQDVLRTPTPLYTHYIPSKEPSIHLEFDYPSSWIFSKRIEPTIAIISLADPRFFTLPTPSADNFHLVPNDFGSVNIFIAPLKSAQTLDVLVELHKQGYDTSWITALREYEIKKDGYDARVLEYQVDDPESSPSLMFERNIIFIVKEQMYQITLLIAEKDRGGEFEQGYEHFFRSLKITP